MSHALYNLMWQQAMEELSEQIEIENPPVKLDERGREIKQEQIAWGDAGQHFAFLYIRYIQIFRKLEDAYDQIVHPQKRRDIKIVLEVVMARICQVKAELVRFNDRANNDFVNLDDYLLDLKIGPDKLSMPVPRYFQRRNRDDDQDTKNRDLMEKCLDEHGVAGQAEEETMTALVPDFTREQAIRIIQKNERARQGAVRAHLMKELRDEEIIRRRMAAAGKAEPDATVAATMIQKSIRGFVARRKVKRMAEEELVFIGMAPPSKKDVSGNASYAPGPKERQIRRNRQTRQDDNELKYIEALSTLRQTVNESEGPDMKDQMWDDRFRWWIKQKELTGKYPKGFDDYYKQLEEPTEEELAAEAAEKKKTEAKTSRGKKAAKPKKAKGKGGKKKGDAEEQFPSVVIQPSTLVNNMLECVHKYKTVWAVLDESENYNQSHDDNLARDKLRPQVAEEIRKEVDIRLISYLDNITLKAAKKGKKKKKTKKKKTKKNKKTKKKGKKCCDGEKSCQHMPLVDMMSRLVKMGILYELRHSAKTLDEFVGSINYLGSAYEAANVPLDPSMAQLRSVVTEHFILPNGSPYVKQNTPLVNTLLLYGPKGSGKTHLAKSVAAATGATWFDLSPRNIASKLGTKSEIAKLVHMVFKVAEELQPSIVYIDEAEKVFIKSSKKSSEIGRLKQMIMQHKSKMDKSNRVIVIGNSTMPYNDKVERKDLNKFFGFKNHGKMLFCPCPGYGTRLELWRHFISETGLDFPELQKAPKFDLDTLAYISEGYSAGNIQQAVLTVLPQRRVKKLQQNSLGFSSVEFITALSKTTYTYRDDYDDFREFTDLVTGEKERQRQKTLALAAQAEASSTQKKKKKK